jgi:hypothetical protein
MKAPRPGAGGAARRPEDAAHRHRAAPRQPRRRARPRRALAAEERAQVGQTFVEGAHARGSATHVRHTAVACAHPENRPAAGRSAG